MLAHCLIRAEPWYRKEAFVRGLRAAGHEVVAHAPVKFDSDTLLVIWNRYGAHHEIAKQVEAAGGAVLVTENGYIGADGSSPKFDVHPAGPKPHHYYTISKSFHNDDGYTPPMWTAERFASSQVKLRPLRALDGHILVCPNRSFGPVERMMHPDWTERVVQRLRKHTSAPIRVRKHPGNSAPKIPLSADLAGAKAMVIWSSSCGVHALINGIPVICEAPYWICKSAALDMKQWGEQISVLEWERRRNLAMEKLFWLQWTCEEIESGIPFRHLLP